MAPVQHILIARERIEPRLVVEILKAEIVVALASTALVGKKKILRHGVRLVPRPRRIAWIFIGAPRVVVFYRMPGQVPQSGVRRLLKNREGLRVLYQRVRIEKSQQQLVVGVGGETVLDVEVGGDGLGVEMIEADHFFARRLL